MKRLLATAAISLALIAPAFAADEKPDYSDKEFYSCTDNEKLATRLKALYEGSTNPFKPNVVYVKNSSEYSREDDLVQCRITMVTGRGPVSGYVIFHWVDGHALFGFNTEPERRKGNGRGKV